MLEENAKNFALNCHQSTNHFYDGYPYEFHLNMVVETAKKFINIVPEKNREMVLAACWIHDTIEDTRVTYNDVKHALGEELAEIAFALTNEKGKTRKERANEKYYQGIRDTPFASFVKICDRIANAEYSRTQESSMANAYKKEFEQFEHSLYEEKYHEMFDYLYSVLFEGSYQH